LGDGYIQTAQVVALNAMEEYMVTLHYNITLCERDMDLLFDESALTDPGF
jgi:hypothetical protein